MLLCLARASDLRIRDLALILGVTERSAQKIVSDLVEAGYVTRTRVGRRNAYQIHVERPLPLSRELTVSNMFELFHPEAMLPGPTERNDPAPEG
jgi:DNA-binding IclR family transcriptional regulator